MYGGNAPNSDGFAQLADNYMWDWGDWLNVHIMERSRPRYRLTFEEASDNCQRSADCAGFRCWIGDWTCSEFFSGSPVLCDSSQESWACYANSWSTSYVKQAGATYQPAPVAVGFHLFQEPGFWTYDSGRDWWTWHGGGRRCTAYHQPSQLSGDGETIVGIDEETAHPYSECWRWRGVSEEDTGGVAVSMTDADGQALDVLEMDTHVAVNGPFAYVSVQFRFINPHDRQIEGRFRYVLPPGASVQRLSMKIFGEWMEGEVVETTLARQIWASLLRERRDPALLEQEQGNVYSMKIFPIESYAEVDIILSYAVVAEMRGGKRQLIIPMVGMPPVVLLKTKVVLELGSQEIADKITGPRGDDLGNVTSAGRTVVEQTTEGIPLSDLIIEIAGGTDEGTKSYFTGDYVVTRQVLGNSVGTPHPRPRGGAWAFYVDTSASTADTFVARLAMLEEFFSAMPNMTEADSCEVWGFDLEVVQLLASTTDLQSDLGGQVREAVNERFPMGMTRMDLALDHILQRQSSVDYVVLITDAMATLGSQGAALTSAIDGYLVDARLYVLNIGTKIDSIVAGELAGIGGGRVVSVAASADEALAASRMRQAWDELLAPVGATGVITPAEPGVTVYPTRVYDLQPNSEVVFYSWGGLSLPSLVINDTALPTADRLEVDFPSSSSFEPVLQRLGVNAELTVMNQQRFLESEASNRSALEAAMVQLSTTNRVLCPLTSLLVLETEEDYTRFGVDRNARNNVLIITDDGISTLRPDPPVYVDAFSAYSEDPNATDTADAEDVESTEESIEMQHGGDATGSPEAASANAAGASRPAGLVLLATLLTSTGHTGLFFGKVTGFAAFFLMGSVILEPVASVAVEPVGFESPLAAASTGPVAELASSLKSAAAAALGAAFGQPLSSALLAAAPALLLQGCNDGGYYYHWHGYFYYYPSWRNLSEWGEQYLADRSAPTNRDPVAARDWAEALSLTGQDADLRLWSKEWLPWDPINPQVFEFLGTASTSLGDNGTAVRAFTSLAELKSSNPEWLLRSAWLLLTVGALDHAARLAQRAIDGRPDNPNGYRALAIAHFLGGNVTRAAEAFDAARWVDDGVYRGVCWGDMPYTPLILAHEWSFLSQGTPEEVVDGHVARFASEGGCAAMGCVDPPSKANCWQAASELGIPRISLTDSTETYAYSSQSNGQALVCWLDCDGGVKYFDSYVHSSAITPQICRCPQSTAKPIVLPLAYVLMSWWSDGTDMNIWIKLQTGMEFSSSRPYAYGTDWVSITDVTEGLGPELLKLNESGSHEIGVQYLTWNQGTSRGALTIWSNATEVPYILPFAIPSASSSIWSIARIDVREDGSISVHSHHVGL